MEVDFHGWTHGERVRQASFQGVRDDKDAKNVVREVKRSLAAATTSFQPVPGPGSRSKTRRSARSLSSIVLPRVWISRTPA
ncbi:MAG TPA: hypothetical protein VFM21_00410 [Terriglobia bacterium]|nr:hypothetical protein [Terriglobia bacterium]